MRRRTGVLLALAGLGVGGAVWAGSSLRPEPFRFPAFGPGIQGRALVVGAGRRYRLSAEDRENDPKGETYKGREVGRWGAHLGTFGVGSAERGVYTALLLAAGGGRWMTF